MEQCTIGSRKREDRQVHVPNSGAALCLARLSQAGPERHPHSDIARSTRLGDGSQGLVQNCTSSYMALYW